MTAIKNALTRCKTVANTAYDTATARKAAGGAIGNLSSSLGGYGGSDQFQNTSGSRSRYSLFRGWAYSAINALATEAAQQPVNVGTMYKRDARKQPGAVKTWKKPKWLQKEADLELQILPDHDLVKSLEIPNAYQHRSQFVYSFIANLCLTGWAYIIGEQTEEGKFEFFSIPTSWVVPDHKKGAFAEFRIVNPNKPESSSSGKPLTRDQVTFAYLPNPSDPFAGLSPTQAQLAGIKIDEQIQSSQAIFFENGVFPSALITVGKNPMDQITRDENGRPRLTGTQRVQVHNAIRKIMAGVANYGNPAIIDGLIERVDRLSATQNEMGWEKSEKVVMSRILSAFGVHPYILGGQIVGSYAAASSVERVMCRKVNWFISLLNATMTDFCRRLTGENDILVWWDDMATVDPLIDMQIWDKGRQRGDIHQNEFRAHIGLPPDADGSPAVIDKTALASVTSVAAQVTAGKITKEQGQALLMSLGLSKKLAKEIAGDGPDEEEDKNQRLPNQLVVGQNGEQQQGTDENTQNQDENEKKEDEDLEKVG